MLLSQEIKDKIISEYNYFKENLYAGKSLEERKKESLKLEILYYVYFTTISKKMNKCMN